MGSSAVQPNYISTASGNVGRSVNIKEQSDTSGKCSHFETLVLTIDAKWHLQKR